VSGLTVIPNPSLTPETAWSFELGNANRWSGVLGWDVALFWTEAYHLIEPHVDTALGRIQFRNVAHARLAGLDLALDATPLTRLTTSLAYTFLYSRDLALDSALAFRPTHLLTLGADYRWGRFGAGGDFRYSSRFGRVELYSDDPRVDAKVLDLRASWEQGPFAARVLLANALDYIYNLVPRTLAPVRTLSVTLTWTY